ncbi:MAG: MlaD family protein [Treponema sp.]|jgi:phospholipid/cholesterol/gamma-HCH transport system substrate-binding protein|nr:MlaD family protein [Treponema sp.]
MNISRYVKVALFFIILGGAGSIYVILSADGFSGFNTVLYEATIPDATGLSTRSKVFLAGVAVGKIRAINLKGNEAQITMALLKNVEVREDAKISRRSSSILGTSMLSLDPGTEFTPILRPGSRIGADTGLSDMAGVVSDLGGQLSAVLQEFRTNQMALLAVSLETFNSLAGKLDARADEELDRISEILESVALITAQTEMLLSANSGEIDASFTDIHLALENIRQITGEIAGGRGNVGQMIYDDRLYAAILSTVEQTEKTVDKLEVVIEDAGEVVKRAAGMGIQIDSNVDYGFLLNQVRAGASLRLEPASADRWYRIGVNGAPNGVTTRTVTTTTAGTTASPGTTTSYTDTSETKYSFSVDAEIARRWGMLTLRGGLLESTAGFGVDFTPLRQVSVSGELFNFGRSGAYPNLTGTVTFYPFFNPDADKPWNWLYLQGGVYDALNSTRDVFIGGGLRFADREVKGLVGLAATAVSQ